MLKRINNWHLSTLIAIVSIFSIAMIQQYADAQGWTDPGTLPGGTPANNLVVNPMVEDLQLGGFDIADSNLRIDGNGTYPIQILNNQYLCLTGDCKNAWPTVSGGGGSSLWSTSTININDIYYTGGKVGIGTADPEADLDIKGNSNTVPVELRIQNGDDESEARIVFEEGNEGDNFRIQYDGAQGGYNNWLEFWGMGSANPLMTIEREYSAANNNYSTVAIGTPQNTHFASKFVVRGGSAGEDVVQFQNFAGNTRFAINGAGNVGIGTTTPDSALEINSDVAGGANLKLSNTAADMSIIFQEYASAPGDFFLSYNGDNAAINGGYSNWLEFWGRDKGQAGAIPILSMQRDYDDTPATDVYQSVGIGVPSETLIDAKLRVQGGALGEDLFQLYDSGGIKRVTVDNNGDVGIKGDVHDGVPLFVNGSSSGYGLKVYSYGLYSYNNSNLELKATNDVYLNPGLGDGVGIDVVNPQQILHVKNSANFADSLFRLENDQAGTFSNQTTQMEFVRGPNWATDYSWVGPTNANTFDIWTMENIPMLFGVGGNESMRINGASVVMDGWPSTAWAGNGAKLNVKGYGNSGIYSEGNPGIHALADDTGSDGGGNGRFMAGYFNGDVHIAPKTGHATDSGFLVLNGLGGVDPAQCTEAAHMGRVHFDKINGILYFCVGDPGNSIPGQWKSLTL